MLGLMCRPGCGFRAWTAGAEPLAWSAMQAQAMLNIKSTLFSPFLSLQSPRLGHPWPRPRFENSIEQVFPIGSRRKT